MSPTERRGGRCRDFFFVCVVCLREDYLDILRVCAVEKWLVAEAIECFIVCSDAGYHRWE